jgi:hypothetical protein
MAQMAANIEGGNSGPADSMEAMIKGEMAK